MAKQAKTTSSSKGASAQSKNVGKQNQKANGPKESTDDVDRVSDQSVDAVSLLKNDHRKVESLFEQYETASDSTQKEQLAHQICQELIIHTQLEEEIFYRKCRENDVDDDMLDEAQVEHDGAKILITELLTLSPQSEFYDAKVKVLCDYITHHVQEEEKDDGIFAKAQASEMDMEEIGQAIQQRKQELTKKAESGRLGLPQPRALFSLMEQPPHQEQQKMARMGGRERDDYGRFTSDDDDDRRGNGGRGRSASSYRERDDQGRFMSDDDDDRRGNGGRGRSSNYRERDDQGRSGSNYRERDEQGRFMSDDEGGYSSRRSGGRYEGEDDDRRYSRGGGQGQGRGGWFGDSEGHSQAAQRGWDDRGSSRSSRYGSDDDDDRRYSRSGGRGQGHGGWFGDSEGHSQAAQRGWEERGSSRSSRYQDDDDDRRGSSRGSGRGGSHEHGGWYGDPRGHSQAARRGWENRGE